MPSARPTARTNLVIGVVLAALFVPALAADSTTSVGATPNILGASSGMDQSRVGGLPFGPSKLPPEMFGGLFTGTKVKVYPKTVVSTLDAARASGMRVVIVLVGSQDNYRNPDGSFSLDMWAASLARFRHVDLSEYIDDGTLIAHQLIDEPKARKQWDGRVITNDVLDEMARQSKEIWPTLPTVVRVEPSKLAKHAGGWEIRWPGFAWHYLDAAWAQYSARKGPVAEYAAEQQAEADRQYLGLVAGLNVLDGGDGSSLIPSPNGAGEWTMSPNELRNYGTTLMTRTEGCAFLMWRYETPGSDLEDVVYFRRPDIKAAMQDLARVAAGERGTACRSVSSGKFRDDNGNAFEPAIEWLAAQGITKGCNPPANTLFCPNRKVTRGQMAAFLVRALDLNDRLVDPFSDDDESIFEDDIERLAAAGITKGCNPPANDRFCPDRPVSREQMAAFLVRALGYTVNGGSDLFIDDDESIFENDIDKLAAAGVTKGCNPPVNNEFCPRDAVTRGQMAALLHRALG